MTVDTSALVVTYTDEEHGEPCCGSNQNPDCPRQALWLMILKHHCEHEPPRIPQCQGHKEITDASARELLAGSWGGHRYVLRCPDCKAKAEWLGWEPIGGKR